MISAYLFTAIAVSLSFAILLGDLIQALGAKAGVMPLSAAMLVFIALVTYAAYRDIRLSSRVGLVLEVISVGIIIVITFLFVRAQGDLVIGPAPTGDLVVQIRCDVFGAALCHFQLLWGFESAATSRQGVGQSAS